jgi:hypothetical protein
MGGYVSIAREAAAGFLTGHGVAGVAKTQVVAVATPLQKYVEIKADLTNTNNVYVGVSNVLTTTGYMLDAGELIRIPVDDMSKVWVIGGAAAQGYSWLAV